VKFLLASLLILGGCATRPWCPESGKPPPGVDCAAWAPAPPGTVIQPAEAEAAATQEPPLRWYPRWYEPQSQPYPRRD